MKRCPTFHCCRILNSMLLVMSWQISKWPNSAAIWKGVIPYLSLGFLFSILLIISWQILSWPLSAATWNAVFPLLFPGFLFSNKFKKSKSSSGRWSDVKPSFLHGFLSPVLLTVYLHSCKLPLSAAIWSGDHCFLPPLNVIDNLKHWWAP